jgi:isopentenyl diphosphate isomerase/L-lactate dehydrogenase-like FMN-dependent dehydrogenase
VRRGTDVLKALALGADAIFVGRPILWGLAAGGQQGIEKVLKVLNDELKNAMIYTGCNSIDEITKNKILYDRNDTIFNHKL